MKAKHTKRIIGMLLIAAFALCTFCPISNAVPYTYTVPNDISAFSTKYVVLYEANTGLVLYEKNGDSHAYPASTTKILTAIVAIESRPLDETVTIGNNVEGSGSTMGLRAGEIFTLEQLLYGMMLVSGNDAARAIAEHISGTRAEFAVLMNAKVQELGLTNCHFANPNGLDAEDHYCSASDMAKIAAYAMKNETFRKIVATETYTIPPTNKNSEGYILENSNRLLHTKEDDDESYKYEYATGIKTGDTSWAGRCLVASAEKNGMQLIAVLYGDYEDSRIGYPRYVNAAKLFDFGFENFTMLPSSELSFESTLTCEVVDATVKTTTLNIGIDGCNICVHNDAIATIKQNASAFGIIPKYYPELTDPAGKLKAPLEKGTEVGVMEYVYNNEVMFRATLTAAEDIVEPDDNTTPGNPVDGKDETEKPDNSWLAWLLVACIIITVVILAVILVNRNPKQLKRSRNRRMRFRR